MPGGADVLAAAPTCPDGGELAKPCTCRYQHTRTPYAMSATAPLQTAFSVPFETQLQWMPAATLSQPGWLVVA